MNIIKYFALEMEASSIQLLQELDQLLDGIDAGASDGFDQDMDDPEYSSQHEEFHKMTTQLQLNVAAISEAAVKMIKDKCLSSFSLCSIGSGDGRFDSLVLKDIQSHYPTINLNYLGVDLNKMSCQTAESNLKSFNNLTFRILNCDAQTMDTTGLEGTYDMVILIHTIIYMTSPNDCLMKCRELIKPNGSLLIVAIHKDPLNELFDRFWYLSAGRKVNFLPDITGVLDTMEGCHYTIATIEGVLDITQYTANGFKSPQQLVALDFIIHTKLANFSQSVRDKCVEYLISISYGKPEKHFVRHIVNLITVKF